MKLTGRTSGAQATISDVRLISDLAADVQGSLFYQIQITLIILDLKLVQNYSLLQMMRIIIQIMLHVRRRSFTSSGTLETVQENIISIEMQELNKDNNSKKEMLTKILELN
ncbi:MAG: hypothetical protein CM15mV12_0380 [uncultured marine virus]|nr:MAG: hypothetical protein CM15mV12_0380 [uncultured marine virus]